MNIAISNIAWREDEEASVADLLQRLRIRGVEIAPGKIGPSLVGPGPIGPKPVDLTDDELRRYRSFWNTRSIEIVAMQALLFGTEGLHVFGSDAARRALIAYLAKVARVGQVLGAQTLVFGSPKNRLVGALGPREVEAIAVPFFRELGAIAADHGLHLCIEPIPPASGADWITTAKEAQAFVKRVDHPGFGLHLDAGALHAQGEGAGEIRAAGGAIRHFHASQPGLTPLAPGGPVPHANYAAALRDVRYARWVSIEMRDAAGQGSNVPAVETAVRYALDVYGA